jgi:hypothetical protein
MIRVFLLLPLCLFITISANAQFWKKKQPIVQRQPLLHDARCLTFDINKAWKFGPTPITNSVVFPRTQYSYDIEEAALMKTLYHTLRFHMYPESVSGFNSLVALYLEQNRYSEAKWYLLQINYFARQQKDDYNTVASLVDLAMVKSQIGEFVQAKQDLQDALDFATVAGRLHDVTEIKKKLVIVEHNRVLNIKNDVKYAEVAEDKKG